MFSNIAQYLKSGGPLSAELKRAYVEGIPFTDPRTRRPALLADSVRPLPGEDTQTAIKRTLRTAAEVLKVALNTGSPADANADGAENLPAMSTPGHPMDTAPSSGAKQTPGVRSFTEDFHGQKRERLEILGKWAPEDVMKVFEMPVFLQATPYERATAISKIFMQVAQSQAHESGSLEELQELEKQALGFLEQIRSFGGGSPGSRFHRF